MSKNTYFQFKQFAIIQGKSAMKVNTDGVVLGAWVNISKIKIALDIGTGTGVIALMLAQRSDAKITGIEIEKNAADEASQNVLHSPWTKRIDIQHISFQKFAGVASAKFDLIISNPPYFINDMRSAKTELAIAKHADKLPLNELAECSCKMLTEDGRLALILPVYSSERFIELANNVNLFLTRLTKIRPKESESPNRFLMEFSKKRTIVVQNEIAIRNEAGDKFTDSYKNLTCDFYLNF